MHRNASFRVQGACRLTVQRSETYSPTPSAKIKNVGSRTSESCVSVFADPLNIRLSRQHPEHDRIKIRL